MQGHTLGGSGGNGDGTKMTPEELRRNRLAALDSSSAARKQPPPPPAAAAMASSSSINATAAAASPTARERRAAATASTNHNNNNDNMNNMPPQTVTFLENDDGDAELQRALAMSLQQQTGGDPDSSSLALQQQQQQPPPSRNIIHGGSMMEDDDSKPPATDPPFVVHVEPYEITPFHAIMWDSQTTTENDKMRWVGQGIHVVHNNSGEGGGGGGVGEDSMSSSSNTKNNSSHYRNILEELAQSHAPWGLQQQHGGPCGVLAAVQAEVLRLLIWGPRSGPTLDYPSLPQHVQPCTQSVSALIRPALARSLGLILARAALTPLAADAGSSSSTSVATAATAARKPVVRLVLPKEGGALQWGDLEPWVTGTGAAVASARLDMYTLQEEETATLAKRPKLQSESTEEAIKKVALQVSDFLLKPRESSSSSWAPLDYFGKPGGVLLLVMSAVASRGASVIQEEFDDPVGTKLTAQFGHCSQELMNLLLTGQSVSNVFDNTMNFGEAMVCRGITSRPAVGYLTQLEALRYCQVGGYYKSPRFPIWVVGSTSHFTVLFGDSSALEETASDKLLEKCRRAFKEVEGADENGFIPVDQLAKVVNSLELDIGDNISTLAAHLEVSGAGIILWDDFWKAASRLLTGATLGNILGDAGDDQPPPLIRAETPPPPTPAPASETDEEMARRLAAEWEAEAAPLRGMDFLGEAARAASPIPMDTSPAAPPAAAAVAPPESTADLSSDEALARKLQAEWGGWDADFGGSVAGGSHEAVGGSPARSDELMPLPATPPRKSFPDAEEDAKPSADRTVRFAEGPKLQFEQYGDSFLLFHYNGLRGGTLTSFRITRLSPEEAVGASIALNRGNASDGSGDLEDVVRTKWPSCMVDWGGKKAPYID